MNLVTLISSGLKIFAVRSDSHTVWNSFVSNFLLQLRRSGKRQEIKPKKTIYSIWQFLVRSILNRDIVRAKEFVADFCDAAQ